MINGLVCSGKSSPETINFPIDQSIDIFQVLGGLCLPSHCDVASTARFLAPRMAPWRLGSRPSKISSNF
jgi:hypothetical protein